MSTPNFDQLVDTAFPNAVEAMRTMPRLATYFRAALGKLNSALAAGRVPNVAHKEMKDVFRRVMEHTWAERVGRPYLYGRGNDEPGLFDLYVDIQGDALHLIGAALRRIDASTLQHPGVAAMRAVLVEFAPIADRMAALKPLIFKRELKSAEERELEARFIPTRSTPDNTRAVWDALVNITGGHVGHLAKAIATDAVQLVESFARATLREQREMLSNPEVRAPVQEAMAEQVGAGQRWELLQDWNERIGRYGIRTAERIRDDFITKVVRKLAPIAEAKRGLPRISEIEDSLKIYRLTGRLLVKFDDGSSFVTESSIVYSHSVHGKAFCRFPLTFHDVRLSNGERMKSPCEERMHGEFLRPVSPSPGPELSISDSDTDEGEDGESDHVSLNTNQGNSYP